MTDSSLIESIFRTPVDEAQNMLSALCLIDICKIDDISENNRATVTLFRMTGNEQVTLSDIEVLTIGNNRGGLVVDGSGCMGLLFAPRASVPTLSTLQMDMNSPSFSKNGIKVLPVSSGRDLNVSACFTSNGDLVISTAKGQQFVFSSASLLLTRDPNMLFSVDEKGNMLFRKGPGEGGTFKYELRETAPVYAGEEDPNLPAGLLTKTLVSPDGKHEWKTEIGADRGTTTISHTINDGHGNIVAENKLSEDIDGNVSLTTHGLGVTISESSGTVTVSLNALNDSNITININAKNVNVTADKVNINNGHLEVT